MLYGILIEKPSRYRPQIFVIFTLGSIDSLLINSKIYLYRSDQNVGPHFAYLCRQWSENLENFLPFLYRVQSIQLPQIRKLTSTWNFKILQPILTKMSWKSWKILSLWHRAQSIQLLQIRKLTSTWNFKIFELILTNRTKNELKILKKMLPFWHLVHSTQFSPIRRSTSTRTFFSQATELTNEVKTSHKQSPIRDLNSIRLRQRHPIIFGIESPEWNKASSYQLGRTFN